MFHDDLGSNKTVIKTINLHRNIKIKETFEGKSKENTVILCKKNNQQ